MVNGCPQEVDCSRSEAELKVWLITEDINHHGMGIILTEEKEPCSDGRRTETENYLNPAFEFNRSFNIDLDLST